MYLPHFAFISLSSTSSTPLTLRILLLHPLLIQPVILLLLLLAHVADILNPSPVAPTRAPLRNAAAAIVDLEPLLAQRLAVVLARLVHARARVVADGGLCARGGLAVDGGGGGREGLRGVR
jgi:hypothetical protein